MKYNACFSDTILKGMGMLWFIWGAGVGVHAQNSVYATEQPGRWDYQYYTESGKGGYRSESNYELTPTQLSAFKRRSMILPNTCTNIRLARTLWDLSLP